MSEQQSARETLTPGSNETSDKSPKSPYADDDKNGRKRMRVPTSCSVCRKRKIKCDKIRPTCGGCSKSHVAHLCHYEEPVWVNSKDLWKHAKPMSPSGTASTSGIAITPPVTAAQNVNGNANGTSSRQVFDELAARVKHIEASIAVSDLSRSMPSFNNNNTASTANHNTINNYADNASSRFQRMPATAGSDFIGGADRVGAPIYDFDPDQTVEFFDFLPFIIKKSRLEYHGGLDPKSIIKKDAHLKIVWIHLWKNFDTSIQQSIETSENGAAGSSNPSTQGFHEFLEMRKQKRTIKKETIDMIAAEPDLNTLILKYLPTKKAIMTLCFRFFKAVYPILPFINENSFFQEVESIFGSWPPMDERPSKLNITSKYDYATIALLFLVMRFAQISIEDHEYDSKPELACLKGVTIHAGHVMISMKCLQQYNFLRKAYSLRVLQVMLYTKLYYRYCPEDDDISDGSEGTIMLGTIYSVALVLGLQTDPEELVSLIKSPKTQSYGQLWRKIWHKILEMDATEAISLGIIPNCPNDLSYDTKLPSDEAGMDDVHAFVVKDFLFMEKKTALYRKIANLFFNRRKKTTALQLVHMIKEIENFMSVHFGSLKDVIGDPTIKSYTKVKKVGYMYELNSILLSLKNRLLTHFYDVGNTKKVFELFDECLTLTMKILNSSLNLYYNINIYFDYGHRMLLRPIAYTAITKVMLMIASLLAKLSQCQRLVPLSDITRANLIKEFFNSLLNNMDVAVQLMATVCAGYYNAQRMMLVLKLFFQKLKDPAFDFAIVARDAIKPRDDGVTLSHDIHAVTVDDIPKSNFIMNLLDTELAYLKAKTENNLMEVLQPLVSPVAPLNPSGTGNGQFYDPTVDSLTAKTPSSLSDAATVSSMGATLPLVLDMNSIFATKNSVSLDSYDPTALSSEEYASLFGLFEDYNFINLEQRDLKGL